MMSAHAAAADTTEDEGEAFRAPPASDDLRAGSLRIRVATTPAEVDAVQALRWRVFYRERGARPDAATLRDERDRDAFDAVADHLVVTDDELGEGPDAVVGTYRLIRRPAAARLGRFYSEDEYDITRLVAHPGRILELGRSCVAEGWRNRGTLQLLWRGIAAYVFRHRIELMFGCASLPGTDLDALGPQLAWLHAHHLAPERIRPRALPHRYVAMGVAEPPALDDRLVQAELPPLIKGYLRLGGFVGDGAVLDRQFNTTDICVVVQTDQVTAKYRGHYERRQSADAGPEADSDIG